MGWRVEKRPNTLRAMDESQAVERVAKALRHLRAFRATFDAGEVVDEGTRLSADDLSVLIEVMDRIEAMAQQGLHTKQ